MMDRDSRPVAGSKVDVTPLPSGRDDLMTNWPEHVDAYLQYVKDVMRMCGAPMGLQADVISLQGRVREQRRPGRGTPQSQMGAMDNRQPLAWPTPPTAQPPLERVVVKPANLGREMMTPEGPVKLNLPDAGLDPAEIPAQFRVGMSHVEESENPRDLS